MSERKTKFLELINGGESENIEWKPSLSQMNEIVEAVSGFSNTAGGKIVVGISRSGKVSGVKIGKDTIERLTNKIIGNTDPKVYPRIRVETVQKKKIIVIEVKESADKLVLAFGRPFRRVGKSTLKMTKNEYERTILEKHKEKLRFDKQICGGSKLEDIDIEKVRWFLKLAKAERKLDISPNLPLEEMLMRLKMSQDTKPINAAILLFGRKPQDFFIQSEVKCIRFKGIDVTGTMIDLKTVKGNIIDQVIEIEKFIFNHISMAAWIEGRKIARQEKWAYPPKAIRETLVNAIVHRDYTSPSKVQIRIFDDRIEFWNPGRLPEGWTIETLKQKHESKPWNPLIARAFFCIKYIEEVGTGTNKIIRWCVKWGLPEPDFEFTGTSLIVTLRKSKLTEEYLKKLDLNERQKKAIQFLRTHSWISNKEYRDLNTIGKVIAVRELRQMVDKGILKTVGKGRAVRYELNE